MSNRLLVGTRKGLFRIERDGSGHWRIAETWFLGGSGFCAVTRTRWPATPRGPQSGPLWRQDTALGRRRPNLVRVSRAGLPAQTGRLGGQGPDAWYRFTLEHAVDLDPGRWWPWRTLVRRHSRRSVNSTDGGDSWALIRSLWDDPRRQKWVGDGYDFAGIHSILVDPRDHQHVTIGVSVGGVWTSKDERATWRLIGTGLRSDYMPPGMEGDPLSQDAHRIVQCPANPDRLWMQHHNGIFRTDDGGENWQELKDVLPSSFGFAVAVHPRDPDTAWFVPATKDEQRIPVDARLVVTRTRDGGAQFDVLHRGLPEVPAYDLVYRHALDVASDGKRLAFGSTTGSLWVSEDQGDSWQTVSRHLPPVSCVRFES